MVDRFRRIQRVFGTGELVRTLILIAGLIGMAIFGVVVLSSAAAAVIAGGGLLIGWAVRNWIARGSDHYAVVVPFGLTVYGIVLFAGDRLGLDREIKLLIITVTKVTVFDLKFWSLSDPDVIPVPAHKYYN